MRNSYAPLSKGVVRMRVNHAPLFFWTPGTVPGVHCLTFHLFRATISPRRFLAVSGISPHIPIFFLSIHPEARDVVVISFLHIIT